MVVIGAGILVRSFLSLLQVDPGFQAHNVLTLRISAPGPGVFTRIQERLRTLPGVQYVAGVNALPLIANRATALRFHVPGSPLINPDALPVAQQRAVSPDYFRAMGVELKSGRAFTERDLQQPVVVINADLARRFWPGEDAVGKKFVVGPWGPNPNWSTIVGVAANVKQFGLDSDASMDIYFPSLVPKYLVVRAAADPLPLVGAIQRELQAIDPAMAIADVRTMDQILAQSAETRRWTTAILGVFAAMALMLALVGIYGVTSWAVAQRTREIGIRMALGAGRGQILGMVLMQGGRLCAIGLGIGIGGALALRRVIASLAFGVSAADPWVYACAIVLLILAAMLACYFPARRAARVAPLVALRWD